MRVFEMADTLQEMLRKIAPDEFLRKYNKLWTAQKRELKSLLGKPPDPKNIDNAQWTKWKREQEAVLTILMVGYASTLMREQAEEFDQYVQQENLYETTQRRYIRQVRSRARFAATRIIRTTRDRLRRQVAGQIADDIPEVSGLDLDVILSRARQEMIVRTEMTASRTAAMSSVFESLVRSGVACQMVWRMRPCDHCTVCPVLDGTPYSFWSLLTNGPPLHPHCCCDLEILIGTRTELLRSGRMRRNPPIADVRREIQRYGFRISPR